MGRSAPVDRAARGGEIDGALVSKPSGDPDEPWKGVATIATTADEIRAASGSFYNQTMAWPSSTSPVTSSRPSRACHSDIVFFIAIYWLSYICFKLPCS